MPTPSVQLYSVRDAVDENLDSAVERLAGIGFTRVEPYAFHLRTADYKRAFAASGITAPSGHAAVIDEDDPAAVFDAAAELGITTVIDPFIPTDRWQTSDDVHRIADRVNELSEQAKARGLEFGETEGLGWIDGQVELIERTDPDIKVPHMGWNDVSPTPHANGASLVQPGEAYFLHSFHFAVEDGRDVAAMTDHGGGLVAAVARDNMLGVQFHPEKSQAYGLALLARFLDWRP